METSKTLEDFARDLPRPAAACTIVKITGSAPQVVGARMWVTKERFRGTIGGGEFERRVLEYARGLIKQESPKAHLKEYVLCKEMGQCCGGRVEVFFEPVLRRRTVHLFGGGHIGRATASVLADMPFDVKLIDGRPEWSKRDGLPAEVDVVSADPLEYAKRHRWSAEEAVCVFTHSHDLDFLLARHFLHQPVGYVGVIGSRHKAEIFQARLKQSANGTSPDGWEALWDERMHCPIGRSFGSKNPKAIAVSIASELLEEWAFKPPGVRRLHIGSRS